MSQWRFCPWYSVWTVDVKSVQGRLLRLRTFSFLMEGLITFSSLCYFRSVRSLLSAWLLSSLTNRDLSNCVSQVFLGHLWAFWWLPRSPRCKNSCGTLYVCRREKVSSTTFWKEIFFWNTYIFDYFCTRNRELFNFIIEFQLLQLKDCRLVDTNHSISTALILPSHYQTSRLLSSSLSLQKK